MQIFFISDWLMIISYFVGWSIIQLLVALSINKLDDKYFNPDNFWLKTRKGELTFYRDVLKIKKWKHYLPDGARASKKGFRKKNLSSFQTDYLETFIFETGKAEIMHWLQIVPFFIFGLWSPPFVVWIMLAYALIVNLPCIITQRYNRPRLVKIYKAKGKQSFKGSISKSEEKKCKIKIIKNGPYIVSGNIPLTEKIITPKDNGYVYTQGEEYEDKETYSLCRCGKTKTPPYCDGSHVEAHFNGVERASEEKYHKRAAVLEGPDLDLLDDDRCAYARFCHRDAGNVWELTLMSDNPELKKEAIIGAYQCPTGRLIAREKDGFEIDPVHPPSIEILQDPEKNVSCGIFVKGGIALEGSDGFIYETRNRYTLCRCGESIIKPFCDASHINYRFRDDK